MTRRRRAGLLLTPGASATRDHSALVAIDNALADLDVVVQRIDLPSRPNPAIERVQAAAEDLAKKAGLPADRIILGGRSFGGRMCSMAVAQGLPALGLLLISYPLHPPGKPEQWRDEHFPDIAVPSVFVSGTRDAFASPEELQEATKAIAGTVTIHFIDGADHGLRRRDSELAKLAHGAVGSLVR